MRQAFTVPLSVAAFMMSSTLLVSAQVPSAGDMQQKLEQEMSNAKRSAGESTSSARQGAGSMKSEAEKKMEETAAQHKSQAEGKMTEEIEKVKQKARDMGR